MYARRLHSFGQFWSRKPTVTLAFREINYVRCAFPILGHLRLPFLGTDVAAPVSGRLHWGCTYGSNYSWMIGYSISAHWSASPISVQQAVVFEVLLWTSQSLVGHWCGTGKLMGLALYPRGRQSRQLPLPLLLLVFFFWSGRWWAICEQVLVCHNGRVCGV